MKSLSWIPVGLVVGFLVGFGVPIGLDLMPVIAVSLLAAGYYLIAEGHVLEN
jgi:hypothetical protein